MMSEDNQCSLDGLDEENKLTIDCLPEEILAVCLSYTGKDLRNARLTCRRFNQIIEDYQYMMNVIPVGVLYINKGKCHDFFSIQQMTHKRSSSGMNTSCKLDELMKYVRFLRPKIVRIGLHLEATDMKNYLTDSWRRSIVELDLYKPLLSIFPSVSGLEIQYSCPSDLPSFLAQISAHPSPICRFTLGSYMCRDLDGNDLILDALSKNSNKYNGRIEELNCDAFCSMEAIIRFLENGKFAEEFYMAICVENYNEYRFDTDEGDSVYVENSGYQKFNNWLSSKGISQSCDMGEFVYRSTQFYVSFCGT